MNRPDLATPEEISSDIRKRADLKLRISDLGGTGFPQNMINHHVLVFNRHHDLI